MRRGLLLLLACALLCPASVGAAEVGTWGLAPSSTAPPLADRTVRMMVRTTVGGDRVRIRLSNAAGRAPLAIGSASIAVRGEGAAAQHPPAALTFRGSRSTSVPAREEVITDPVAFDVPPGADLAVSIHVPSLVTNVTAHLMARKTSYLAAGDHTGDVDGDAFVQTTTSALFLTEVIVTSPAAGTIVGLGSSSVDGTGTRTDAEERWSDVMARRLLAERPPCGRYGYVNEGVDADTLDGMRARLERDVLSRPGVRYVILYLGSGNDIATGDSADEAIAQTREIVQVLRERRIRVVGGTLIPREQGTLPGQEAEREKYNAWVRRGGDGAFDAVIDFETPVEDPNRPGRYKPGFSDDGIHAGPEGNRLQGETIDLGIFDAAGACAPAAGPGSDARASRFRPRLLVRTARRGSTLSVRGRLRLPRGLIKSRACPGGRVDVRIRRDGRTVARRRARVGRTCRFSARLPNRRGRVVVHFRGTPILAPVRRRL